MQRHINRFQLMEKRRTESASALEIVISRVLINLLFAFCCCRRCGDVEILSLAAKAAAAASQVIFNTTWSSFALYMPPARPLGTMTKAEKDLLGRRRRFQERPHQPKRRSLAARPNDRHLRDLHCTPALWAFRRMPSTQLVYYMLFRLCVN